MLHSPTEHYRRQQQITARALQSSRRARRVKDLVAVVTAFQFAAARDAADSVPLMLKEQGIADDPAGSVAAASLAGIASDGRPLDSLLPLAQTPVALDLMVVTQIQDAARVASSVAITARPNVSGWVRMMNPPSCSRCAVLAGKWFRWNDGFERHPRCDCRHIPAQEADYADVTLSGDKWFHTLDEGEQNRIFTKSGAQAIRDGADLNQVVNARSGMQRTQLFGRDVTLTTTGTTRRAQAFEALSRRGGSSRRAEELVTRNTSRGPELRRVYRERANAPRLMPESIYDIAEDRADAIRLLKVNGYLL